MKTCNPYHYPLTAGRYCLKKEDWIARNGKWNIFTSGSRRLKPKLNGVGKLWSRWSILSSYLSQFAKSYQICFRYSCLRNQQIGYNRYLLFNRLFWNSIFQCSELSSSPVDNNKPAEININSSIFFIFWHYQMFGEWNNIRHQSS